jgi:hypothetical protein
MEICFGGLEVEFLVQEQRCVLEISAVASFIILDDQTVILYLIELIFGDLVKDALLFILTVKIAFGWPKPCQICSEQKPQIW